MSTNTLLERIAKLEQKAETADEQNKQILAMLDEVRGELGRYKGFIGAVSFLISCIGVFFTVWPVFRK